MRIISHPCVISLLVVLCASELPASLSFLVRDTPLRSLLADGATAKRIEVKPMVPASWGSVVTVGGQLCFNFSCERGEKDILPFYDLPKRFHENAKVQHRYSKRDAEQQKRNKIRSNSEPPSVGIMHGGHRSVIMKASGGGLGFGSSGDPGKRKEVKKDDGRGQSGMSKYKAENPGTFPEVEMQFTCNKCETRQAKRFTRLAYEEGVVVVKCAGCGVHHLIADNQAYFKDWTGMDKTNVEKMLAEKGETVDNRMGKLYKGADGTLELRLAQPPTPDTDPA